MRNHNLQLPDYEELQKILAREAVRNVSTEKFSLHFVDFSPIIAFCTSVGISPDYFTHWQQEADLQNSLFREQLKEIEEKCVQALGMFTGDQDLIDELWDYLAEEDRLEKVDLLMVFGAPGQLRIQKAVELYHAGFAEYMLLTGKGPVRSTSEGSEAELWQNYALQQWVPKDAILLETKSISIPDNVKSSLNMLDSLDANVRSMILVTSPYALRRTYAYMQKFLHTEVTVLRVAAGSKYTKENWYTTPEGQKVIINEYVKLKVSELLNTV